MDTNAESRGDAGGDDYGDFKDNVDACAADITRALNALQARYSAITMLAALAECMADGLRIARRKPQGAARARLILLKIDRRSRMSR